QPIPQGGEYDAEATAFVHLPPEDLANEALAAPGQGYVPPMILPLTPATGLDPAATGSWVVRTQSQQEQEEAERARHEQRMRYEQQLRHEQQLRYEQQAQAAAAGQAPPDAVHWPDPNQQYQEPSPATSATTGQWNFAEAPAPAPEPHAPAAYDERGGQQGHPGQHDLHDLPAEPVGHTGQWTIPVASGDLPEESGEFTTSALASQWHPDTPPPAALPDGASAPWATAPEPEAAAAPRPDDTLYGPFDAPQDTLEALDALAPADPTHEYAAPVADPATGPVLDPIAPSIEAAAPIAEPEPEPQPEPESQPELDRIDDRIDAPSEHPAVSYVLHVNGIDRPVSDAWIGESLLYVLRERLGLAGAKDGCSQGECGACNVQVDGRLVASCLVPAATAAGSEVRTVEGLAVDGEPSDVQRALADCGAVQCGFCIPGMAMTVHDLLEGNHAPSELETRQALSGNLCRCSGYRGVLDAVREVIAGREHTAEQSVTPDGDEARIPRQAAPGAGSVQAHPHEGDAR
ncbi:MAG TPA: (2Fe-2S)-binding protein, partial [Streptomyces sp.]